MEKNNNTKRKGKTKWTEDENVILLDAYGEQESILQEFNMAINLHTDEMAKKTG